MENRSSSGLAGPAVIFILLAALGLGPALRRSPAPAAAPSTGGGTGSTAPASRTAAAGPELNGGYEHGAGYLLEKFFSTLTDKTENGTKQWATHLVPNPNPKTAENFPPADPRGGYSVRFLIALLPAPTSPPLQYLFDSELEALQLAAGTAHYSLDSFDLPWTGGSKDSSGKSQPVGTNSDSESRWKRDPGLILFRNGQKLLVVFVVGETPTAGINQIALRDALDQITWLEGWQSPAAEHPPSPYLRQAIAQFQPDPDPLGDPRSEIRIVGPSFSGSAPSLRNTLEEWRHLPLAPERLRSVLIISGTATAISDELSGPEESGLPTIIFHRTMIPDVVLWRQIPHLIEQISEVPREPQRDNSARAPHTRIALLHEDTAYGIASDTKDKSDDVDPAILRMSFPLHISALRTANPGQDKTTIGPDLGHQDLALPDESGQQRRDVIQTFSPRAAVYDQLVLSNLLVTIKREHIRYVGIVATDVEDLVFLVQQLRMYCPNTVVFATSADIGFLHTQVNTDLRGMLLFTTYPLFTRLQNWTFPFEGKTVRQTFPNDLAQGVYNATLAQLGMPKEMQDYGEPFIANPPCPVIQVGVVGRNDIWPVAFQLPGLGQENHVLSSPSSALGPDAQGCVESTAPRDSTRIDRENVYPRPFRFLFLALNLGFLACAAALTFGRSYLRGKPPPALAQRWWANAIFADPGDNLFARQRRLYLMFFAVGMLLAEIVGLGFALVPRILDLELAFEVLTAVVIFEVTIQAAGRVVKSFRPASLMAVGWWMFAAGASILLAILFVAHLWLHGPWAFALYTFSRATHLHSGVSPLMALIFLATAGFTLIVGGFWRVAMLEDRPLPGPLMPEKSETPSLRGVAKLWERIAELQGHSAMVVPEAKFFIALLAAAFLYFFFSEVLRVSSIDGWRFDALFTLLAFGIYSMFSLALLRFMFTWMALRRLLQRLYFHPSRYSYKNLQLAAQSNNPDRQKIHLYESRPGLTAIEYALGCARAIVRIAHRESKAAEHSDLVTSIAACTNLKPTLDAAEALLEEVLKDRGWAATIAMRKALYAAMTELSTIVVTLFEPVWRISDRDLDLDLVAAEDKPTVDKKLAEQAELFIAARVGDFLRNVFPHLLNLVGFAMPAVLAMVLAVSVYPFPAHDTLLWVGWTVLLATVVVSLYVFVSINRNPIVSMFSGTQPGKFNWDSTFTMHLVLFAVIPILTLVGAQFPQALSGTVSWIGSVLGSGGGG